jgi:hypothetical protein
MGWAHVSDLGWGRRPKLHGMQGVTTVSGGMSVPSSTVWRLRRRP